MKPDETLHRVMLPYAVFGVIEKGGKVVDVAPIGKWMVGQDLGMIKAWVETRKGTIE